MNSRKELITDMVNIYIKNHKEEYKTFLKMMEEKRGELKNANTARFTDEEGRHAWKFPEGLYFALNQLAYPRFLEDDGESLWFSKKFPQFLVPYQK